MVEHEVQVFDELKRRDRKEKKFVCIGKYVVTLPPFQAQISLEILVISIGFIGHVAFGGVVEVEVLVVAA